MPEKNGNGIASSEAILLKKAIVLDNSISTDMLSKNI